MGRWEFCRENAGQGWLGRTSKEGNPAHVMSPMRTDAPPTDLASATASSSTVPGSNGHRGNFGSGTPVEMSQDERVEYPPGGGEIGTHVEYRPEG